MTPGASKAAMMIIQPALAPSPQPRPAPTVRALPAELAVQRGPFWMPIRGPNPTPIDIMERQAELQQPVFEIHEELLPICLELTAEHHIICVPTDDHRPGCTPSSPLVNPEIDDVVKKNIRKDGADPRPLRSARLHRSPWAALKDAGLEPPLNQAEHPGVGDPVRQHSHQPSVVNGIEEGADVDIEHKVHTLRHQGLV